MSGFFSKIKNFFLMRLSKRAFYISMALIFVLGLAFAYGVYSFVIDPSDPKEFIKEEKVDTRVESPLNGVKVTEAVSKRRPFAVMIENHPDARPQSSLDVASVVYEAIVEGGITRFMALYVENEPGEIGPIRSARSYYIDWLSEFDAFYVHDGGSTEALQRIAQESVLDLKNSKTYLWRSISRYSPHNLYGSYEKLVEYAKKKKYDLKNTYESGDFKEETTLDLRPESQNPITINFSSNSYKVVYHYDQKTNSYKREMGGAPHIDAKTSNQITAKVVIVQYMPTRPSNINPDKGLLDITTLGEGKVLIFQDGGVTEGTWSKAAVSSRTKFYDLSGNIIKINPGQHWFEIVRIDTSVTY